MNTSDIRVLEIGDDVAVAYCGLQFALWGAEVVVDTTALGTLPNQQPAMQGVSLPWLYQSAGKTLLEGDVKGLCKTADIVLTTLDENQLRTRGLAPGENTIVHRIVPYAKGGELEGRPAMGLMLEAAAGYLNINGDKDREPARAPGNLIQYIAGVHAFVASLAALHKRTVTGEAEIIETAELDALTTITPFLRSQYTERADTRQKGGPGTGVRIWPVGDGFISANLFGKRTFNLAMEQLGIDLADVPEHLDEPEKRYDTAAMKAFLIDQTAGMSAEKLFNDMLSADMPPVGLLLSPKQLLSNEHLKAIDYFKPLSHDVLGELTVPGAPARFDRIEPPVPAAARKANRHEWRAAPLPTGKGEQGHRPLEGVRIIDFTQAWIGPFASMTLADLGAEVIKIESHKRVDVWRNWAGNIPPDNVANKNAHPYNTSGNFNSANRNKREIAIDLTRPEGVEIARELIRTADVVMNNYTPRVMRKFGLDHDSIKAIKKDIISVAWAGYGDQGPYANYKANGTTIEAMAGWDALFGYRDDEPIVMGFYQADAITGLQMAACTVLALMHRDLTGEGQYVSGSMLKSAIPYIGEEIVAASLGQENVRWGNRHPDMSPHGVFQCQGENRYVAIACPNDEDWRQLCSVVGIHASKFHSLEQRRRHEDQIEGMIAAWSKCQARDDAVRALQRVKVPVAPVLDALEILEHPEFTKRNWFKPQVHADMGEKLHAGFPWQFAHCELRADYPPPRLGEHSEEILKELGYDEGRIRALIDADTVGCVLEKEEEARVESA